MNREMMMRMREECEQKLRLGTTALQIAETLERDLGRSGFRVIRIPFGVTQSFQSQAFAIVAEIAKLGIPAEKIEPAWKHAMSCQHGCASSTREALLARRAELLRELAEIEALLSC